MERHMDNIKEVTAWAVVDKDGELKFIDDLFEIKSNATGVASLRNEFQKELAPHRVIRVRIVPDTEEQK
jgi:hypothetical protein